MNNKNENNENTNILVVSTVLGLLAWVLALAKLVKNENTVQVESTSQKTENGFTLRVVTMTWQAAKAAQTAASTGFSGLVAALTAPATALPEHRHAKVLAKLAHRLKNEVGRFAEMNIRLRVVPSGATVLELMGKKVPQISPDGLKDAGDRLRKYKGFSMGLYSEFVFIVNALVYTGQISRGEAKNQMNLIACVKMQKEGQAVKNHDRPDYLLTLDETNPDDPVVMESLPTEVALVNADGIEIYPSKFEAWLASYLKDHQVDQEGRENRSGSRARTTWMKKAKLTWKFSKRYGVELPNEMREKGWKPAGELGEFVRMCIKQGCFKDKHALGYEFQIMHGLQIKQRGVNEVPDVLYGENRWTLWGLIASMTNPAAWLESATKMNANITDDRLDDGLPYLSLKRLLRGDETETEGLSEESLLGDVQAALGCRDGFPKVRTPLAIGVCATTENEAMEQINNMANHEGSDVRNWWNGESMNKEYLPLPDAQMHPKHGTIVIAATVKIDGEEFPVFDCVRRADDEKKESRGGSHKGKGKGRNRGNKPRKPKTA
jgi:hypothetical protein